MNVPATQFGRSSRSFAHLAKGLLFLVCIITLSVPTSISANPSSGGTAEYAVKAAYIYNILRFVSWNETSALAQTETLNICLFKNNPLSQHLAPIRNKSIGDKPIRLKTIKNASDSVSCHLIFFNDTDNFDLKKIKHHDSILLGNNVSFTKSGGLFSFYIENNKVKLAASRAAITNTELNISSLLIEVCQLYGEEQ